MHVFLTQFIPQASEPAHFPQLCVGNDANDAIIGQMGGIPPIVSFLGSGLDNPLMVKAVTAAMHLLRDESYNKVMFCNCGGNTNAYIHCKSLHSCLLVLVPFCFFHDLHHVKTLFITALLSAPCPKALSNFCTYLIPSAKNLSLVQVRISFE